MISISLHLTYKCQLSCLHCYTSSKPERQKELNKNEVVVIFNKIKEINEITNPDNSTIAIDITGGEPLFLGIDFIKFVIDTASKHFSHLSVNLISNLIGYTKKIGQQIMSMIEEYGIDFKFETSFDPVIRTLDGSYVKFKKVWQQKYKEAKEDGLAPVVFFTFTKYLKNFDIIRFINENNISCLRIDPFTTFGRGKIFSHNCIVSRKEYSEYMIELDKLIGDRLYPTTSLKELLRRPEQWSIRSLDCWGNTFKNHYIIEPCGTIRNCKMWGGFQDGIYGNIFSDRAEDIVFSKARLSSIFQRVSLSSSSECQKCRYLEFCKGGCFCRGHLIPGDGECSGYKSLLDYLARV